MITKAIKYPLILALCCLISAASAQTTYEVTLFAGLAVRGYKDGPKDSALFNAPYGLLKDSAGNIFVGELANSCIRKISAAGNVTTYAGIARNKTSKDGAIGTVTFNQVAAMCFDKSGNMIVVDNYGDRIRKITKDGIVSTLAGTGSRGSNDGPALEATFRTPRAICMDDTGNFYITEANTVRKLSVNGMVTTIAAGFTNPQGIVIDKSGNLLLADPTNNAIKKITLTGTVSTFANVSGVVHMCFDDSGYLISTARTMIVRISPDGSITDTIAGGQTEGNRNGVGRSAQFRLINGIIMIAPGEFIVSEHMGTLRKITAKTVAPPKPDYKNIPGSICLGSTVSYEPTTTGSIPELTLKADSSEMSAAKFYHRHNDDVYIVNANDSILRYDKLGNLLQVYNDLPLLTGVRSVVADETGRLYIVAIDQNTQYPVIYRFNADGSWDISWQTPMYYFTGISDMTLGPDGYLYVVDSVNVVLEKVDTATALGTTLHSSNSQYSLYKPAGVAFDKNGTLYVADVGHNRILRRDPTNGNFYDVFDKFDTLKWNISRIDIDKTSDEFIMQASSGGRAPFKTVQIRGLQNTQIIDYGFIPGLNEPAGIFEVEEPGKAPVYWVLNSGSNNLKKYEIYAFTITPKLPAGLRYDFTTGEISGTPLAPSPAKTYIIKVTNNQGSSSDTIFFGVTPPGPLSSASGVSNSPLMNHKDGLTVQYFKENNCERMIEISDSAGGKTPGNVLVSQEVFPTVASFQSKSFVGRVTKINTSDPEAAARLKLYFTFQDIENYNANNGASQDLSNDTANGTMQVAVLQMHTDTNGREQAIKHNPVSATWISKDQNWMVDFQIQNFSTFYMGDPATVDEFDCANAGGDSLIVEGGEYIWWGTRLTSSGTYFQTLPNANGCDSIATLKLTLTGDSTTGSRVVYSNTSIRIYPNPGTGVFDIEIKNLASTDYTITVVNTMGAEVYRATSNGISRLDLRSLPDGIYFVRIAGGNVNATSRIIKQE